MPLIELVAVPEHFTCLHSRLMHEVPPPPPPTLGVPPPPQVWGAVHVPQSLVRPPHPSETGPQFAPDVAHVFLMHGEVLEPQTLGLPPPPHVRGALHEPHVTRPPQPSAA